MNEIMLKVDFATDKYEFAVAENLEFVRHNLSKMDFLSKIVAAERSEGKTRSDLITVFGRWVVVYVLDQLPKAKDNSTMLFFALDVDLNLLNEVNEGQEELTRGIMKAMDQYKEVFDPKIHDIARLVYQQPAQ